MKRTSVIAFLATVLICASIYIVVIPAQSTGYTIVGGVINSDTTWTLNNSPYFLTSPVLVNSSVTLTIEPGVTVYLNNTYIRVDGTLNATGTRANKISLIRNDTSGVLSDFDKAAILFTINSTSWNETSKTGSIIENAIVTNAQHLGVQTIQISSSPKINNSTIINTGDQCSIYVQNGSPVISNNTITSYSVGISSSLPFSREMGANTSILNNIISGCKTGIVVSGGYPIIERNLIINNTGNKLGDGGGIKIYDQYTTPLVRNNTITRNTVGFNIFYSPLSMIAFNNIQDNKEYSIYLSEGSASNTNATYNYWGTNNTSAINQTIRDFKNDFNLGTVNFVPFLNTTNPEAPIVPTFTITASAGAGGSISPNGNVSVSYGDSQTFNVTANSGYQIVGVLMDGKPVTAPYIFTNVNSGHTISATFQQAVPEAFPPWIILTLLTTITLAIFLTTRKQRKTLIKSTTKRPSLDFQSFQAMQAL